ncbi:MAG TPA: exodeoxyribonuclease VII large subunit [Chloroflexota bacterium]|nr:exodeoxyribonuclease VII large subunit [Chloroflexota bacterium]
MRIFEVAEVVRYARELLERDPLLADLWIRGEVSSVSTSSAGHIYFALRGDACQLRCVMFRREARLLAAPLEAGQAVIVHGAISLYEAQGAFQLYADLVEPEGTGLWYLQFELLRRRLEAEGLFAPERKRPLPLYPRRIGIATSPNGAVIHDILRILERRYPLAEVVLCPCAVQGETAPSEIVAALQRLNEYAASRLPESQRAAAIDVIILARGGGAPEELAVFNDERVARAIFASAIPVISAIGHETDYTIADLVADVRAPTPSVAAELVATDVQAIRARLAECRRRLAQGMRALLQEHRRRAERGRDRLRWHAPRAQIAAGRQTIDLLVQRGYHALRQQLDAGRRRLEARKVQLLTLNPETTLARGYALCYAARTGALITAPSQVLPGDAVDIRLHHGVLRATVQSTATPAADTHESRIGRGTTNGHRAGNV